MAMMDIKDAKAVIRDLSEKPFICGKHTIETDSGYVITTKEKSKYARVKKQTNADRIRAMSDAELKPFLFNFLQNYSFETDIELEEWLQSEVEE